MNSNVTATEAMLGAPYEDLVSGQTPQPPDRDPFYQPPSGYQHAKPGTVMRSRGVELGFLGVIPKGSPPLSCSTAALTCTTNPRWR